MKNVYIVTARSATDAVKKIKQLRAKDAPVLPPSESSIAEMKKEAEEHIAAVRLDQLDSKFNDVLDVLQHKCIAWLQSLTTGANVAWDFKKISDNGTDAEELKKAYDEVIKKYQNLCEEFDEAGIKLSDTKNQKTVARWVPWFQDIIDKASDNVETAYKEAKDVRSERNEKAAAKKSKYNTVK